MRLYSWQINMNNYLRLIFTYNCHRSCPKCCNKNWHYEEPKVFELKDSKYLLGNYKGMILTGGEPLLFPKKINRFFLDLEDELGKQRFLDLEKILYTTHSSQFLKYSDLFIDFLNGITFTIHEQHEVEDFYQLNYTLKNQLINKSLHLNVFSGIKINKKFVSEWKIKYIEWLDDCPLPENETLYKLKQE